MDREEQIEEMAEKRNEIKDIMKLLDKCVSLNPMYKAEYANAKLRGDKPFEIRLNDRDFKVGDIIKYHCIDSPIVDRNISVLLYEIVYITDYAQKEGYVVFTDREVEE